MKRWTIKVRRGVGDSTLRFYDLRTPDGKRADSTSLVWRAPRYAQMLGLDREKPYELRWKDFMSSEHRRYFFSLADVRHYLDHGCG